MYNMEIENNRKSKLPQVAQVISDSAVSSAHN